MTPVEAEVKFWSASEELPDAPEVPANLPPALERLGPSPFPKSGFPFLGFLATVYDHVASHVGGVDAPADAPGEPGGQKVGPG